MVNISIDSVDPMPDDVLIICLSGRASTLTSRSCNAASDIMELEVEFL